MVGKPIPKPKKSKKLTVTKVQDAVNAAIRRRDGTCIVRDGRHGCAGILTASHFFAVGGNSCLRFYPFNIFGQCFGHHGIHERKHDPVFYHNFMLRNYPEELEWMERNQGKYIKYMVLGDKKVHAVVDDEVRCADYIYRYSDRKASLERQMRQRELANTIMSFSKIPEFSSKINWNECFKFALEQLGVENSAKFLVSETSMPLEGFEKNLFADKMPKEQE